MKGRLKIILLKALDENPGKSGAEIARIIKEKIGTEPSPGSLYPLLNNLKGKELVISEKSGKKKTYQLSEKGKEAIDGIEEHRKEIMEKVIRGLRTYEYVFEEEEIEELISHLEQTKECPEDLPNSIIKLEKIKSLIMNNNVDEDKAFEILKQAENKINKSIQNG